MNFLDHIRTIPDFPKPGIQFKDITTLLKHPEAFAQVIDQLEQRYKNSGITKVIGVESRGFIFGAPLANKLNVGFVPIRKAGKLPAETYQKSYALEYGEATIELHKDALDSNDRVLIIDDLLATGGTLAASVELVEEAGATVTAIWVLIELGFLNGRNVLPGKTVHSELVLT
ncbi:MAG: adenine phosphoribosyltransferase [Sumerlaeia bacterium]